MDKVVGALLNGDEYHLKSNAIIISTSTGEQVPGRSLGEALKQIVCDVLSETMRWSAVTQAMASKFRDQDAMLISIGPVRAANSLLREMANAGVKTVDSFEIQPLRQSQSRNTSGDIAIVGVAGRLPGGETLEEIWASLEEGKDLHKKARMGYLGCESLLIFGRYQKIGLTWTPIATPPERSRTLL